MLDFETTLANNTRESNVTLNSSILRCCSFRARNKDKNCVPGIMRTEDCSYYLGILQRNSWHIASAVYLHKVTDHLHLLVSINTFPTATRIFHKAEKSRFTKIVTAQFKFFYTDTQWQGYGHPHYHTPHILLPKVSSRGRLSINMPPFYMLHSLCSIPSTLEYNLRESLQVQLHLTRKGGEEHLIQVFLF